MQRFIKTFKTKCCCTGEDTSGRKGTKVIHLEKPQTPFRTFYRSVGSYTGYPNQDFNEGKSANHAVNQISPNRENVVRLNDELEATLQELECVKLKFESCVEERNNLRERLSQCTETQMTSINRNVTNIGDPNRPQILAARISELFDNQWTDAFTYLSNAQNMSQTEITQFLLKLFMTIFDTCSGAAHDQLRDLHDTIASFVGCEEIPEYVLLHIKLYKEERKKNFKHHLSDINKDILQKLQNMHGSQIKSQEIRSYIEESIRVCWLMCIQDPPMALDSCNSGEKFDKNRYKSYTEVGKTVAYVVWPAIRQYEGGPLISKGVAQGLEKFSRHQHAKEDESYNNSSENYENDSDANSDNRHLKPKSKETTVCDSDSHGCIRRTTKDAQFMQAINHSAIQKHERSVQFHGMSLNWDHAPLTLDQVGQRRSREQKESFYPYHPPTNQYRDNNSHYFERTVDPRFNVQNTGTQRISRSLSPMQSSDSRHGFNTLSKLYTQKRSKTSMHH